MKFLRSRVKSVLLASFLFISSVSFAQNHEHPEKEHTDETSPENLHADEHHDDHEEVDYFGQFIFHHIGDDYRFPLIKDIYIPLPVIIYDPQSGLDIFLSNHFPKKYYYHHGELVIAEFDEHGHPVHNAEGKVMGRREATFSDLFAGNKNVFYNFSITKIVFGILLSCAIILLIFFSIAKRYKRHPNSAPRGLQGFMEMLILYIQNDVVKPSIGEKKYRKFLPYLLTLFFFIWINNSIGLIPIFPGGANVTGNIAVTMVLALAALVLQVIHANKNFWGHIFWFPGVPVPVKLLLAVIEFVGLFSKPFALMIRLFANITAGHILIMSIIGIAFTMKQAWIGWAGATFSIAMYMLEVLVALIQAYIFTLLTALMIGSAVEEGHGHEHEHEAVHGH